MELHDEVMRERCQLRHVECHDRCLQFVTVAVSSTLPPFHPGVTRCVNGN